jgi:hypothetical protein
VNPLPYCTPDNGAKVIVCVCPLEPEDWTWKNPDTGLAASKVLEPDCDAVMLQVPVLLRFTIAEETPPLPPLPSGVTV